MSDMLNAIEQNILDVHTVADLIRECGEADHVYLYSGHAGEDPAQAQYTYSTRWYPLVLVVHVTRSGVLQFGVADYSDTGDR